MVNSKRTREILEYGWNIRDLCSYEKGCFTKFKKPKSMVIFPGCCSIHLSLINGGRNWIGIEREIRLKDGTTTNLQRHMKEHHQVDDIGTKQYIVDPMNGEYNHEFNLDRRYTFCVHVNDQDTKCLDLHPMRYQLEMALYIPSTDCGEPTPEWPKNLLDNIGELLETGHLSDFTIITADEHKPIRAHKNILASRSPVFKAMFDSGLEESKTNVLKRDDIDSETMKVFVDYLYTDALNFEESTSVELKTTVLKLADQYQIPRLKHLCEVELATDYDADSIFEILHTAHIYNVEYLKKCGIKYIKSNKTTLASDPRTVELVAASKELGIDILKALVSKSKLI